MPRYGLEEVITPKAIFPVPFTEASSLVFAPYNQGWLISTKEHGNYSITKKNCKALDLKGIIIGATSNRVLTQSLIK